MEFRSFGVVRKVGIAPRDRGVEDAEAAVDQVGRVRETLSYRPFGADLILYQPLGLETS
jgi:hypothetical protein